MNARLISITVSLIAFCLGASALARDKNSKPGPLTGTWECTVHGGPNNGMNFSLTLEQEGETVTGSVTSPIGSSELSSATFRKNTLEIHIDSDEGNWLLTGKLKGGQLSGDWAHGEQEKGTWEGQKQAPQKQAS